MKNISITGGAGFIGQKFIKKLQSESLDFRIKVLDSFNPQIHDKLSEKRFRKNFPEISLMADDILNEDAIDWLIKDVDIIIHLAAETGTGQSMYNIVDYTNTNITGTSLILEKLLKGDD